MDDTTVSAPSDACAEAAPSAAAAAPSPAPPAPCTTIDGSTHEGGGQILRMAAGLAAITRRRVKVEKIRAGRKVPGLSPQHLTGLRLVEQMCGGTLSGGAVRSTTVSLDPGALVAGSYAADTGTAGSCTLLVQQALPCMLFAGAAAGGGQAAQCRQLSSLELRGGTDAAFAPPVGYLEHVFVPALSALLPDVCEGLKVRVARRGFYPKGGGRIEVAARALAPGTALPPLDVCERGTVRPLN
jgi:RNA 3'-terminal phosphate cyclase (ATP)